MSDETPWNDDPFAPEVVEAAIARSLRPGTPATRDTRLVRTLADAYALPPPTDAALARGRARLAQRAEALSIGGHQMISSDTWPAPTRSTTPTRSPTQPPRPPRRRLSPFETFLRTAAAVLVVALLGGGFYALLHSMQGNETKPRPTPSPTQSPISATATPTAIPPQPPAPAGVYVTMQGTLFRINASTGAIQQRFPLTSLGQGYSGTPVVGNGMVYFTYQSNVVALSATSGALLWRTQTAAELGQLVLANGILYGGTLVPDAGTDSNGTGTETFYALRASDGSVLWTFNTWTLRSPAVVAGGVVYLTDQPSNPPIQHVRALHAADGSQLWDFPLPQACASADNIAADAGMVFVACHALGDMGQGGNGSLYGLRASDGAVVWHITTDGEPIGGLAAGAGLLYYSPGGKNAAGVNASGLYALDAASGTVRWSEVNGGGPLVLDGTTLFGELLIGHPQISPSSSTDLAAFSASSGTVLWTFPETNQRIQSVPVVGGGVVYQILDEQVVALSAANGSVLWRSSALGSQQVGLDGLAVVTGG